MTHYEFHEYANIFPMLEGQELDALRVDIEANGQINKIILYQGKVLDGRNRYAVCMMLGIEPETIVYSGDDPLGLVLSQNLHRRHLTESQRASAAAKIANIAHGGYRHGKSQDANLRLDSMTQSEAARLMNVSERTITSAKKVLNEGTPELVEAMEQGKIAASAAAKIATKPADQQRETLAKCETEGNGRLGKDGKLRPAKYAPRKKTVAKSSEPEESEDYINLPYDHNGEFIKFALPLDVSSMHNTITRRFKHESREMREKIVKEVQGLAVIIKYLIHENYIEETNN